MSDVKRNLLYYLKTNHKGKAGAITVRRIIDLYALDATDPDVRHALRELNLEGYPVVTCQSGIYWATEPEDLDRYMASLSSRATKIFERMRAINKTRAREFIKGQMELF